MSREQGYDSMLLRCCQGGWKQLEMRLLGCLGWRMAVVLLAIAVLFFLSLHSNMFPKDTTKLRLNDLLSKACGKAQPLFTALLQEQCENFSTDGSNAAFIVETRKHNKLPLVLANLAGILPDWTLYLMHGDENSMYVQSLPVVERLQKTGQIHLITLQNVSKLFQDETYELSRGAYNCLLRTRAFWSCSRAEHVLIFQSDSILCAGSPYSVDDFLEYDYIGAPWPEGKVGNGGLSLRRRQAMLELIENKAAWSVPEDLYFTIGINRSKRFRVAPVELAQRFSTDRVYEESVGSLASRNDQQCVYGSSCIGEGPKALADVSHLPSWFVVFSFITSGKSGWHSATKVLHLECISHPRFNLETPRSFCRAAQKQKRWTLPGLSVPCTTETCISIFTGFSITFLSLPLALWAVWFCSCGSVACLRWAAQAKCNLRRLRSSVGGFRLVSSG